MINRTRLAHPKGEHGESHWPKGLAFVGNQRKQFPSLSQTKEKGNFFVEAM
jgi:hypothetical protein